MYQIGSDVSYRDILEVSNMRRITITVDPDTIRRLRLLSERLAISQSAVVRLAVREMAQEVVVA